MKGHKIPSGLAKTLRKPVEIEVVKPVELVKRLKKTYDFGNEHLGHMVEENGVITSTIDIMPTNAIIYGDEVLLQYDERIVGIADPLFRGQIRFTGPIHLMDYSKRNPNERVIVVEHDGPKEYLYTFRPR
jgi:hypothetical protein